MTKVAIITDTHFGVRESSPLFLDYFEDFYKNIFFPTLIKNKIKTVLHLGDCYDKRKGVNFYALERSKTMFFNRLEELGIKVHVLVGNHDAYHKNTNQTNSIDLLLSEYKNVDPISFPTEITVDGTTICMMPWICKDNYEESMAMFKSTTADIMMGHFEIRGFAMHKGMTSEDGFELEAFDKFEHVFSGHYHHKSNKGNITYLGNPYQLTWSDYGDVRGFHLFDVGTHELEFIPNTYEMFHKITYNDSTPNNFNPEDYVGKFVKLNVENKSNPQQFEKFLADLSEKNPSDIAVVENYIDIENQDEEHDTEVTDTVTILQNYVDNIEDDNIDKSKLKKILIELYNDSMRLDAQ